MSFEELTGAAPPPERPPGEPADAALLDTLARADLEIVERMPWSSNATFLGHLPDPDVLVIYKPRRGERPLWDFPPGTLCDREVAAYAVSEALGWRIVPPTVVRADGPFGAGMVQLFVDHDPDEHYLELRDRYPDRFRHFAAFDVVVNNADRKSGHCLRDARDHVWGIDHGVTFNVQPKLRTVIWDFAGERLAPGVADDLCRVHRRLEGDLGRTLTGLLSPDEIRETGERIERLADAGTLPHPSGDYPFPWPLV